MASDINTLQNPARAPIASVVIIEQQQTSVHESKPATSIVPNQIAPCADNIAVSTLSALSSPRDALPIEELQPSITVSDITRGLGKRNRSRDSLTRPQAVSARLVRISSGVQDLPAPAIPPPLTLEDTDMAQPLRSVSILVASLGNPPPYHSTRHSAAHIVLQYLQSSMELPAFRPKSKPYGGGHVSIGADVGRPELTLYQSAVLMNVSGPPLLKAWRNFASIQDGAGRTPGLVILHDEMEIDPGKVRVRKGQNSAKGHNGLKSVQNSLLSAGVLAPSPNRFLKIGIGIGRPAGGSRASDDVSAYVLGQLTAKERDGLQQSVGDLAMTLYREIEKMSKT